MRTASVVAYPLASVCLFLACSATPRPFDTIRRSFEVLSEQSPLHDLIMPPTGEVSTGVIISDVIGKTQNIAIFSGLTRDIDDVAKRLDNAGQNATVLAPDNSVMRGLKRKPWEEPEDYDSFGANAYEGSAGEDRARKNLERFVQRHIVPESPWEEGKKVKTLAGNEVWWESKDGQKKVSLVRVCISLLRSLPDPLHNFYIHHKPSQAMAIFQTHIRKCIQPGDVKVTSIADKVSNGEVWILGGSLANTPTVKATNRHLVSFTYKQFLLDPAFVYWLFVCFVFRAVYFCKPLRPASQARPATMNFSSGDLAICETCGTQYDVPLSHHPSSCRICDDPRQYVPAAGQTWSSLNAEQGLQKNTFETDAKDNRIHYITTKPLSPSELPASLASSSTTRKQLGIGERAILIQTTQGNVLWDLIAFIDPATIDFINSKGGLKAIVISHPHFYTTHLEWARIFKCPIYVSKDDAEWLNREDTVGVRKWISGSQEIGEVQGEVRAIQCGGHFDGSLVLLWEKEKRLFIADTMMSVPSGFYHKNRLPGTVSYSFQWSYPNLIPLPPAKIHGIWNAIKPYEFDTTYGAFPGQNVTRPDLKKQVLESMKIFCKVGGHETAAVYNESI
ncbi:hypothetical protein FB567DRAFT_496128 [Paraphoma chrysanthemicola]|uniref:Metallo-beta-lactamase domain-containing protein n=1 Tax=Paraphoma chrysanthemicola TaxID=798071 RepID=A0A8K0VXQ2_9PLEO|nr:hypothetical protein FB567DRAFT_496128 [Paraphoma chrysanthemicola]